MSAREQEVKKLANKVDLDIITSYVLRTGVIACIALIVTGVVLLFVRNGGMGHSLAYLAHFTQTLGSDQIPFSQLPQGIASLDGVYYIVLGLWVLIFAPISVVFIAILDFIKEKNRLYVVMSLIVLFNLFVAMLVIPRFL